VAHQVLLLTAGEPGGFVHVQRRLLAQWEQAWRECGLRPPAPPVTDESVTLGGAEDAPAFLTHAGRWLAIASDS
jgi:hypothetical protein